MEKITITAEELQTLKNLQDDNQRIRQEFGEIALAKLNLQDREENAKTFLKQLRSSEQEFGKSLSDKYGNGSLDISTGEFTPIAE
jgi:hypothetical protein